MTDAEQAVIDAATDWRANRGSYDLAATSRVALALSDALAALDDQETP